MSENKTVAAAPKDPLEILMRLGKGTLTLAVPIEANGAQVTALAYDYTTLTGRDYADAVDVDRVYDGVNLTSKQGLELFAVACEKGKNECDRTDIRFRLSAIDAVKAVQLSQLFFRASNLAGDMHITNE